MARFQPVILGSDINAYGMARAFHEQYGVKSLALAQLQLAPTRFSRIVDVRVHPDFTRPKVFVETLLELGRRMRKEDPDRVLLLIPCGDVYANLLSEHGDQLREYFAEWLSIEFPGRKKAFVLDDPTQVDTLLRRAYAPDTRER